jgi:hypothetical protein
VRQINKQRRNEMNLKEYYKALLNEQLNEGAKEAQRKAGRFGKIFRGIPSGEKEVYRDRLQGGIASRAKEFVKRKVLGIAPPAGVERTERARADAVRARAKVGRSVGAREAEVRDAAIGTGERTMPAATRVLGSDAEMRIAALGKAGGDPRLKGSTQPTLRTLGAMGRQATAARGGSEFVRLGPADGRPYRPR